MRRELGALHCMPILPVGIFYAVCLSVTICACVTAAWLRTRSRPAEIAFVARNLLCTFFPQDTSEKSPGMIPFDDVGVWFKLDEGQQPGMEDVIEYSF